MDMPTRSRLPLSSVIGLAYLPQPLTVLNILHENTCVNVFVEFKLQFDIIILELNSAQILTLVKPGAVQGGQGAVFRIQEQ